VLAEYSSAAAQHQALAAGGARRRVLVQRGFNWRAIFAWLAGFLVYDWARVSAVSDSSPSSPA